MDMDRFRLLLLAILVVAVLSLGGCAMPSPTPTPTPTRTPRPTVTPTPTLTPTPSPTPTPAFPVTVGCSELVPSDACSLFRTEVEADPAHFIWGADAPADVVLTGRNSESAEVIGQWTYAVAAPFFTVDDDVTLADLRSTWRGGPSGPFTLHPLLATTDTVASLIDHWGPPGESSVRLVAADQLLQEAEAVDGWAILPFHTLMPEWKVLRLEDISLLEKGVDLSTYPLQLPLYVENRRGPEVGALLTPIAGVLANRDESQMTVVVMTGVTAMTRRTAVLMDTKGVTYPARDIAHWFSDADFVHVSNEVSFKPD